MKSPSLILAALGCLALAVPVMTAPASAYVVRKVVVRHYGPMGHGCRTVRTVRRGFGGRSVVVRRICR